MNRRILLMTLGALSIVPTLALGKGTRPTDENIRALLAAGEEETAAVLEEPFVREVAAGTLSPGTSRRIFTTSTTTRFLSIVSATASKGTIGRFAAVGPKKRAR